MPHLTKFAAFFMAVTLVLLTGCGREDAPAASRNHDASGNVAETDNHQPVLRAASLDPSITKVNVDRLIRNQKDHSGVLAVQGVVVQCYEERGAFVMVDEEEFKSCGLEACTDAAMPVRVARDQFEGVLPQPGQLVTLVGSFEALDRGFQFDLKEVHREGSVILAQRQHESQ